MNKVSAIFDGLTSWDVLRWERPSASGIALAASLLLWYFLVAQANNMITIVCRLVLFGMVVGGASRGGLFSLDEDAVAQTMLSFFSERRLRSFAHGMYPALTWKCPKLSAALLAVSLILSYVTATMSFSISILVMIMLVFGCPPAYYKNEDKIQQHISKVRTAVNGVGKKAEKLDTEDFTKKIN